MKTNAIDTSHINKNNNVASVQILDAGNVFGDFVHRRKSIVGQDDASLMSREPCTPRQSNPSAF